MREANACIATGPPPIPARIRAIRPAYDKLPPVNAFTPAKAFCSPRLPAFSRLPEQMPGFFRDGAAWHLTGVGVKPFT
jgi:hypothetical protein